MMLKIVYCKHSRTRLTTFLPSVWRQVKNSESFLPCHWLPWTPDLSRPCGTWRRKTQVYKFITCYDQYNRYFRCCRLLVLVREKRFAANGKSVLSTSNVLRFSTVYKASCTYFIKVSSSCRLKDSQEGSSFLVAWSCKRKTRLHTVTRNLNT